MILTDDQTETAAEASEIADTEFERILAFEAIENFRDCGGYRAAGGTVRQGLLFRAAHQALATPADLARFSSLGVQLVVDMRRPTERGNQPSLRQQGWSGTTIDNDLGDAAEAPHLAFLRNNDLSPAAIHSYLLSWYRTAMLDSRHRDLFARGIKALAKTNGAALVHCTAGKDRTGLFVALVHGILGVRRDDITSDYLLSNAVLTETRLAGVSQNMSKTLGRDIRIETVKAFLGVSPELLETALDAAAKSCGSLGAYLASVGIDSGICRDLTEKFVA